jgi:hypothetical protein
MSIVKQLAPNIVVDDHGNIWQYVNDGMGGLAGFDWKQIGTYFAPFVAAGAGWIASKGRPKEPVYAQQPTGAQVQATSNGLFAGIDTTTLLLIGGAVLLFMSMPPSGRR